jgi:rare lipoprotein A
MIDLPMLPSYNCNGRTMQAIANHSKSHFRYSLIAGVVLFTGWSLIGSTGTQHGVIAQGASQSSPHTHRWFQLGRASWYGHTLQGLPTASGEAFDMNGMTCAHRSLPLGALIRVTNLRNHRSVVVRVNDRGPMVETRIVDLSYKAAKMLGFHGTVRVRLDLIDLRPTQEEIARLNWPDPAEQP